MCVQEHVLVNQTLSEGKQKKTTKTFINGLIQKYVCKLPSLESKHRVKASQDFGDVYCCSTHIISFCTPLRPRSKLAPCMSSRTLCNWVFRIYLLDRHRGCQLSQSTETTIRGTCASLCACPNPDKKRSWRTATRLPFDEQAPSLNSTFWHLAVHEFPYVLPSEPQTGA